MAHLFGDSFDKYTATTDITPKWTNFSPNSSLDTTGRYGGRCTGHGNSGGVAGGAYKTFSSGYTTIIVMGDYKRVSGTSVSTSILYLSEDGTTHVNVIHNGTTGTFSLALNGTIFATTAIGYATDVWWHLQFKITIGDSANATMYIEGQEVINGTYDTKNGGTGIVNGVAFTCSNASNATQWDNIAIWDTSGSNCNSLLTAVPRYYILSPTTEGTTQDWTPSTGTDNAATVDETPNNGDTDYNSSSTLNALDLLNMSDLSLSNATILVVQNNIIARKEDSGTRSVAPIFRINSTNYVGTALAIGATYTAYSSIHETNPDTAVAWTISDVNAVQAGYKITA